MSTVMAKVMNMIMNIHTAVDIAMNVDHPAVVQENARMKQLRCCLICWIIMNIMQQNWIRWQKIYRSWEWMQQQNKSEKQYQISRKVIFG